MFLPTMATLPLTEIFERCSAITSPGTSFRKSMPAPRGSEIDDGAVGQGIEAARELDASRAFEPDRAPTDPLSFDRATRHEQEPGLDRLTSTPAGDRPGVDDEAAVVGEVQRARAGASADGRQAVVDHQDLRDGREIDSPVVGGAAPVGLIRHGDAVSLSGPEQGGRPAVGERGEACCGDEEGRGDHGQNVHSG